MTSPANPNDGSTGDGNGVIPSYVIVPARPPASPITTVARETLAQADNTFERQLNVAALTEPIRVTYGPDRLGGQLTRPMPYGAGGIVMAVFWGRGPVQSIGSLTVNNATPPATVIATHYLGTTSQTVDAKLVSAFAAVGITHTAAFPGIAYTVLEFQPGADIGDVHAIIQGRLIYDPRDGTQTLGTPSTYKYTDNPALALADLLTNTTYGFGRSVDWTSVAAAANACDAIVSGEKKRLIGYTLGTRMKASQALEILRAHAGCYIVKSGSSYKLVPDATASSVRTFNKADIVAGSVSWQIADAQDQPNVVQVEYVDTSVIPWQTLPAIYPTNGLPPSGEELRLSGGVQLPGVQRYSQAMREAIERRNHARAEALTYRFQTYLNAANIEPGDVITVNDGGLTGGITFRVLSRAWVKKGVWQIEARKYDPAAFDSSAAASPTTNNTTLPSASAPPSITNLTVAEVSSAAASGAFTTQLQINWTGVTYPFLRDYRVMIYDESTLVQDGATATTGFTSQPVAIGHNYRVFVFVRSSVAQGSGVAVAYTVNGSTAAALGEMLWGSYPIVSDTSLSVPYEYQKGLGDPQTHTTAAAYAGGSISLMTLAELPTGSGGALSGATSALSSYKFLYDVSYPTLGSSGSFNASTPTTKLIWTGVAVGTVFSTPRKCRLVAKINYDRIAGNANIDVRYVNLKYVNGAPTGNTVSYGSTTQQLEILNPGKLSLAIRTTSALEWAIVEVHIPSTLYVYTPTTTETQTVTSSASGALTITCTNNFAKLKGLPIVTAQSTSPRYPVVSNITYGSACTFDLRVYDENGALTATPCSIAIEGTV